MLISAKSIGICYRKKERRIKALDGVEISLCGGELTVITGRSGSGKTTLINVLAGLLAPTEGQVYYDDTSIYNAGDKQLSSFRNKNIGYIPQGQSALANLTVMQNILLPAALAKENKQEFAEHLLGAVGLEKLKNAYPEELSGGELRRLAAARALINSPSVIFADEPTNDLDDDNASMMLKLLKAQSKRGATVIIVTHDSTAPDFADRIFHMNDGRIITKENEHENTLCRPLVS